MRSIILEGKKHIVQLLKYLELADANFDGMQDAQEYVESLDKWESLLKEEKDQKGESTWEKIGTFDLHDLIEPEEEPE